MNNKKLVWIKDNEFGLRHVYEYVVKDLIKDIKNGRIFKRLVDINGMKYLKQYKFEISYNSKEEYYELNMIEIKSFDPYKFFGGGAIPGNYFSIIIENISKNNIIYNFELFKAIDFLLKKQCQDLNIKLDIDFSYKDFLIWLFHYYFECKCINIESNYENININLINASDIFHNRKNFEFNTQLKVEKGFIVDRETSLIINKIPIKGAIELNIHLTHNVTC